MKPDSLKLVDMLSLDDEITGCRPLSRAWGDEEIFLDRWGQYDQVFNARPKGSLSSQELFQPESAGTFLLLRSEHVGKIIDALRQHVDELQVTTTEQLETLEKWKSLSLATHRHLVAYIFNHAVPEDPPAPVVKTKDKQPWTITVKTRNLQFILLLLLGLLVIPLGLLVFLNALLKGQPAPMSIGLALLLIFGVVLWLFRRAYVRSVKYFSDEGLVRNDGHKFSWIELSRVVDKIKINRVTQVKSVWRTEIEFKNGQSAWLLPLKIVNYAEVYDLVRKLPCEHTEVKY
ncbi:MAG TPA: hypothetical protein VI306_18805 [Pyrinomonadaceae bacterium]